MAVALIVAVGGLLPVPGGSASGLKVHARAAAKPRAAVQGGDVETWLAEMKFHVPDSAFAEIHLSPSWPAPDIWLQVKSVVCSGLTIGSARRPGSAGPRRVDGGMRSEFRPEGPALRIGLSKVNATCQAVVDYHAPGLFGASGEAKGTITAHEAALSVDTAVSSSDMLEPRVPDSAHMGNCSSHLHLTMSIDGGSAWTQVVNHIPGVENAVQGAVDDALNKLACGAALERLGELLNGTLANAATMARRMIGVPAPLPPPADHSWVVWARLPLVQWVERAQREFLHPSQFLDRLFSYLEPTGEMCVLGTGERAMWPPTCLFGGTNDTSCAIRHSLMNESDAPASLRVEVADARLAPRGIDAGFILPRGASWISNATIANASMRSVLDIRFAGWAGGAELADSHVQLGWNLDMAKLHGALHTVLGLDSKSFAEVPDFQRPHPGCLASSVRYLEMADAELTFTVTGAELHLARNTEANSPLVAEVVKLAQDTLRLLRRFDLALVALLHGFVRDDGRRALTTLMQDWATLQKESGRCPTPLGQEVRNDGLFRGRLIDPHLAEECIGFGAVCLGLAALLAPLLRRRRGGGAERVSPAEADAAAQTPAPEPAESTRHAACGRLQQQPSWRCDALVAAAPAQHAATAVAVPLALASCALLFVASNVMEFGATTFNLEQGGYPGPEPRATVQVVEVMVYSVIYSVRRLWEIPENRLLGWVLFCASFLLPYLKLGLLFVCWLLPTRVLPGALRGRVLVFLDQIGKWALVDIFVIQFISTALFAAVHLEQPGNSPLTVGLRTNQEVGFSVFFCATVGSLLIGHFILHCHESHEAVLCGETSLENPCNGRGNSRCSRDDAAGESRRRQVERRILGPALLCTLALAVAGTVAPAFTVSLRTPFVELGPYQHSLWSCGVQLPELSEHPRGVQARFGQAVYFFFAVGVVHLHLLWLLCVWLFPHLAERHSWALGVVRSTFAWAALDVALLSMVVTMAELNVSEFGLVRGARKSELEAIFGHTLPDNLLKVDVSFDAGVYLLFPVTLLHPLIGRRVLAAAATGSFPSRSAAAQEAGGQWDGYSLECHEPLEVGGRLGRRPDVAAIMLEQSLAPARRGDGWEAISPSASSASLESSPPFTLSPL